MDNKLLQRKEGGEKPYSGISETSHVFL